MTKGEALDGDQIELTPDKFFEPFMVEDEIQIHAVLMNVCWAAQSNKNYRITKEELLDKFEMLWDHVAQLPKVSKYQ